MNMRDEKSVVEILNGFIQKAGADSAVIAFDSVVLYEGLRNTRRSTSSALPEVNDLLSGTSVCRELGGIYTVCEYEGSVWFLIRADKAVSVSDNFIPSSKVIPKVAGSFLK